MQAPTGYNDAPPPRKKSNWIWIVVGVVVVCGCGGVGILGAVLVPVFLQARTGAIRQQCISNTKQIAMAQIMYATDNNDHWAPAFTWVDATAKDAHGFPYTCPAVRRLRGQYGYAMNASLGGKATGDLAKTDSTILVYETVTQKRNASGDPKTDPKPNRHGNGRTESYGDGHARWIKEGFDSSGSR